jgi:hypothetical protein
MFPKRANSDTSFSWSSVLITILVVIFLAIVLIAWRLRIDYSDTFAIFGNARRIATLNGDSYEPSRALFMPLLLSSIFIFEGKGLGPEGALITSHLLAAALYGLLLLTVFRLFRMRLAEVPALLGTLLLALNPLILHMAPMAKEDLPATLFITAAFYFYLRAADSRRKREFILSGLLAWAAIATRHNLIPAFFLVVAANELLSRQTRLGWKGPGFFFLKGELVNAKILALLILPVALFLLAPSVIYPLLGRTLWGDGHKKFLAEMFAQFSGLPPQDGWQNYVFVFKAATLPVLGCAAVGMIGCWRRRERGALLFALWLGVVFILQTYVVAYKEARFLLPMFPAMYFFAAHGLQRGGEWLANRVRSPRQDTLACVLGLTLIMALPVGNAAREFLRFSDPVYTVNFQKEVSEYAANLAGDRGRLCWFGPEYPLHPEDYFFDEDDEYTSLYHFHSHVVEFYTGRKVLRANHPRALQDGCVVIWNSERATYQTRNLPTDLLPLEVRRLRMMEFVPTRENRFEWRIGGQPTPSVIEISVSQRFLDVRGSDVRDGNYELLLWVRGAEGPLVVGEVRTRDGKFHVQLVLSKLPYSREPSKFALRYFDQTRRFVQPSARINK